MRQQQLLLIQRAAAGDVDVDEITVSASSFFDGKRRDKPAYFFITHLGSVTERVAS